MDDDGVPLGDSSTTPAWLRKLYLPLNERFNLIALTWSAAPLAGRGSRAAASRAPAPSSAASSPEPTASTGKTGSPSTTSKGAWIEVLDASLRPAPGAAPADPAAPAGLSAAASVKLHALFGLVADAPLPAIALTSQPLNLVPPSAGQVAEHCTLFGYLPVFSSAREVSAERLAGGRNINYGC